MHSITYDNLSPLLIELVPSLRPAYEAELAQWGGDTPGQHIVYGLVLDPYLISLLKRDNRGASEEETLQRIFTFLEELATHQDPRVQEVIASTVCEDLGGDPTALHAARSYMGTVTREFSDATELAWRG